MTYEKARLTTAVVEPVGGHGGMDYYDSGLCLGLFENNINSVWYTCDITTARGWREIEVARPFKRIWGKGAMTGRGIRFVIGLVNTMIDSRKRGVRVVHFHYFKVGVLEVIGNLLARAFGFSIVATVHDVETFQRGRDSRLLKKMLYGTCSRLVVHNLFSKEELLKCDGVLNGNVVVVPHGSYLNLVPPRVNCQEARKKLGLPLDERVLLFFGQIKEVKGLDILIEAFSKARIALAPCRLVIAGKVWKDDFSRYQSLIDDLCLSDFIKLEIRYIPDDETPLFYSAADLVVLPYRKIYQSGVLLMAMSYGVPVLASDLPGMKEVINDGVNGFLFEEGNSDDLASRLVYVMSDRVDREVVARSAMSDMKSKYDWNSIGKLLAVVYHEVAETK